MIPRSSHTPHNRHHYQSGDADEHSHTPSERLSPALTTTCHDPDECAVCNIYADHFDLLSLRSRLPPLPRSPSLSASASAFALASAAADPYIQGLQRGLVLRQTQTQQQSDTDELISRYRSRIASSHLKTQYLEAESSARQNAIHTLQMQVTKDAMEIELLKRELAMERDRSAALEVMSDELQMELMDERRMSMRTRRNDAGVGGSTSRANANAYSHSYPYGFDEDFIWDDDWEKDGERDDSGDERYLNHAFATWESAPAPPVSPTAATSTGTTHPPPRAPPSPLSPTSSWGWVYDVPATVASPATGKGAHTTIGDHDSGFYWEDYQSDSYFEEANHHHHNVDEGNKHASTSASALSLASASNLPLPSTSASTSALTSTDIALARARARLHAHTSSSLANNSVVAGSTKSDWRWEWETPVPLRVVVVEDDDDDADEEETDVVPSKFKLIKEKLVKSKAKRDLGRTGTSASTSSSSSNTSNTPSSSPSSSRDAGLLPSPVSLPPALQNPSPTARQPKHAHTTSEQELTIAQIVSLIAIASSSSSSSSAPSSSKASSTAITPTTPESALAQIKTLIQIAERTPKKRRSEAQVWLLINWRRPSPPPSPPPSAATSVSTSRVSQAQAQAQAQVQVQQPRKLPLSLPISVPVPVPVLVPTTEVHQTPELKARRARAPQAPYHPTLILPDVPEIHVDASASGVGFYFAVPPTSPGSISLSAASTSSASTSPSSFGNIAFGNANANITTKNMTTATTTTTTIKNKHQWLAYRFSAGGHPSIPLGSSGQIVISWAELIAVEMGVHVLRGFGYGCVGTGVSAVAGDVDDDEHEDEAEDADDSGSQSSEQPKSRLKPRTRIIVRSDNIGVVRALSYPSFSSSSPPTTPPKSKSNPWTPAHGLNTIVHRILRTCAEYHMELDVRWVRSRENRADGPSRATWGGVWNVNAALHGIVALVPSGAAGVGTSAGGNATCNGKETTEMEMVDWKLLQTVRYAVDVDDTLGGMGMGIALERVPDHLSAFLIPVGVGDGKRPA